LAELQRLKILPKAHIYDAELRPVRDLLRRRTNLVQQRTALYLSFKSLYARTTGQTMPLQQGRNPRPAPFGSKLGLRQIGFRKALEPDG